MLLMSTDSRAGVVNGERDEIDTAESARILLCHLRTLVAKIYGDVGAVVFKCLASGLC